MDYKKIEIAQINALWNLQVAYKNEIGEDAPTEQDQERLILAIEKGIIDFYGAWNDSELVGCCSMTKGFSTFNYSSSGVLEDFYICPSYRHKGIARELVKFAYKESGVGSLTVGCADCDIEMYTALGFSIKLGNLLAFA